MEEALAALLLANGPIAALVGTRVNWNLFPQGTGNPAVALYVVSGVPGYTLQGADDATMNRVQVDVRALTFGSAMAVSRAIKAKLSGFSGVQSGILFQAVFLDAERQSSEKPGTELFHRVSMDFQVWHSPA